MFLILAAIVALGTIAGSIVPGVALSCDIPQPCRNTSDSTNLLPEAERAAIAGNPAARRHYDAWLAHPGIRLGWIGLNLLENGPLIALLLAVGVALRRLGERRDNVLARALPWLRRASRAAIVLAVVRLFADSLRAALLFGGIEHPKSLQFPINLEDLFLPLLLAFAAYATVWALEAGIKAERDLADFV